MPRYRVAERIVEAERVTLTLDESARILRTSPPEVRNAIRRGELTDVGRDSRRRVDPDELARLVEARVEAGQLPHEVLGELAQLVATPAPS